ncbi:MAG: hypothetical protein IJ841_04235 [Prevotella sp.]|nr:hypothetical protein [Prevotella sp.]
MKKKLLLAALAMFGVMGAQAYEVGQYAYTKTQRVKIAGENLVQNGTFAEGLAVGGWTSMAVDGQVSPDVWKVMDGIGPNGEAGIESQGATADEVLGNIWGNFEGGQTYIVSFDIKSTSGYESTTITTYNSKGTKVISNNCADFFLNSDGSLTHAKSTDDAPVVNVATATAFNEGWTNVSFVFTPDEGQMLVMHFEKLKTGTQITNFEIHKATPVFDDRIALRKLEWANKILADENFNTEQAQAAKEEFMYVHQALQEDLAVGLEDESEADNLMTAFDEGLAAFMDASSDNMATEANFKYVTDLTAMPKLNRKSIKGNQTQGGFMFRQDGVATGGETNWQHGQGGVYVQCAIQGSYNNPGASVALYNTTLPAGKYYIAAEMRNGYMDNNYNYTYSMEKNVKAFVGTDTVDCGTIVGEDFTKFYMVGELKEGETFEAGFRWEGHNAGSGFHIYNFECRAFGNVAAEAERAAAWATFITQYNAVVSARKNLIAMQSDNNYPWEKDSLQRALDQWDPYYNAIMAKGWVAEDGSDTRVATIDELKDWADYHGVQMFDEEGNMLKFQLSRGYQNATNYVKAQNQPLADLATEIDKATQKLNDDLNQLGDKNTFKAAIDAAQTLLDNTKANSTDATREADEAAVLAAVETLKAAEDAFIASVPVLTPIVDIDFSNGFEPIKEMVGDEENGFEETITGYAIKGAVNQMNFTVASVYANEDGTFANDQTTFALGCGGAEVVNGDVLRIGKGTATVNLAEGDIPTDEDVIRTTFDAWFGALINRSVVIELQNAAGQRVAGFDYSLYGGSTSYNDFDNAAGEGLNIPSCGVSTGKDENAVILSDKYKWSFDLIIDYKANTAQALLPVSPKGMKNGGRVALNNTLEDNKIAKFVISSNYDNTGRRSWFDNLKIVKYKSSAAGIDQNVGIATVAAEKADNAIYNLMGVRLNSKPAKGLYIMNGKKYMAK